MIEVHYKKTPHTRGSLSGTERSQRHRPIARRANRQSGTRTDITEPVRGYAGNTREYARIRENTRRIRDNTRMNTRTNTRRIRENTRRIRENTREYARIRENTRRIRGYAGYAENTREYARIRGEYANTQANTRQYAVNTREYAGYARGYSANTREYSADVHSTPPRICVWDLLYHSWHHHQQATKNRCSYGIMVGGTQLPAGPEAQSAAPFA